MGNNQVYGILQLSWEKTSGITAFFFGGGRGGIPKN